MANENLNLKIGVDTSQFDSSLRGMKDELRELEKVDISILSDADAKKVIGRMGDLKASIGDVAMEMKQSDPGNFFNSFSTLAGPAIAGISGLAVGMEMFGVESEKVEGIQRKLMATISILSTLQTIADADKLKTLIKQIPLQYQELRAKVANTLAIKAETTAVVANTAAKETGGVAIKKLTFLQQLWNKAVMANPIVTLVVAIAALTAGIYLLSKAFGDNNEKVKESEKAMDGSIIKNEALRKSHNDSIRTMRDLNLEYRKVSGAISDQQYQLEQLNNQYKDNVYTIENEYAKKTEDAIENSTTFWNGLWDVVRSGGNQQIQHFYRIQRQTEAAAEVFVEKTKVMTDADAEQKQRLLIQQESFNKSMSGMIDMLNTEIVEGEKNKAKNIRDMRLKEIEGSKADESLKQQAILAVNRNYNKAILKINEAAADKQKDLRKKTIDEMNSWLSDMFDEGITKQEKELRELVSSADKLKLALDTAFPTDMDKRSSEYIEGVKNINSALDSYTNKVNENYKELYSKELFEFRVANNLLTIEQLEKDEIESIKKMDSFKRLTTEEQNKIIQNIEKKYDDKEIELEKQKIQKLSSMGINMNKELLDDGIDELNNMLNNKLITEEQYLEARNALRLQYDDKYIAEMAVKQNLESEMKYMKEEMLYTAVDGLMNLMAMNQDVRHQEEMDRLQEQYDTKLGLLDKELEYGTLTQEEYNQRRDELNKKQAEEEKKLKEKQARDQKRMALYQVGIDTAMGIAKTLATFGIPVGLPLMALAASMGALQASLIAAQPLPKFRTGSKEPFEETGNAYIHQGEMVVRKEVVDFGNNRDIIRRLNQTPIGDLSMSGNGGITAQQMIEYVNISFEKYNQIPVVVKENEITNIQNLIKTIRVNSET